MLACGLYIVFYYSYFFCRPIYYAFDRLSSIKMDFRSRATLEPTSRKSIHQHVKNNSWGVYFTSDILCRRRAPEGCRRGR